MVSNDVVDKEKFQEIANEVTDKVLTELKKAYDEGKIHQFLIKYDLERPWFPCNSKNPKVIVIGQTSVDKEQLLKVVKKNGLNPSSFEFYLNYDDINKIQIERLRCNGSYSDIFIGPNPHKVKNMGDYSSIIAMIEANSNDFAHMIKLKDSNGLKITKTSFDKAIKESIIYAKKNNN